MSAGKPSAPLTAADVMTRTPHTCTPESPVMEALLIFRGEDCGAVPVVDPTGKPVGLLTDRDVALALADLGDGLANLPVSAVSTPGVIAVGPSTTLDDVAAKFSANSVRRALVVDVDGVLLGIVGLADLAPHLPDVRLGRVVSDVLSQE